MCQGGIYLEILNRKRVLTLKTLNQHQSVSWDGTALFRCANQKQRPPLPEERAEASSFTTVGQGAEAGVLMGGEGIQLLSPLGKLL